MSNIFSITDPGWDWQYTAAMLLVPSIALTLLLITLAVRQSIRGRSRKKVLEYVANGLGVALLLSGMFGGLMVALEGDDRWDEKIKAQKLDALEDMGYTEIDIAYDKFTASDDGEYVKGALIELEDLKYEVVELNSKG